MIKLKLRNAILIKYGTQEDFALAVGNAAPVVSRVVRGRQTLSAEAQQRWAKALDAPVKELFSDGQPLD
jgi:transcriptional regulator with XRE-family HTH domain